MKLSLTGCGARSEGRGEYLRNVYELDRVVAEGEDHGEEEDPCDGKSLPDLVGAVRVLFAKDHDQDLGDILA